MAENVLVTGGAGFIGSHLVDALLQAGHRVRVLDNLEPQVHGGLRERGEKPAYLNPGAEFILGDVRDPRVVKHALQGIDVVFHLAALVGVGQSMYEIARYTDVNAHGAAVLLQAIIESKTPPRKLLVASSMSIYGEGAYTCPEHGLVFPSLRSDNQLRSGEWELNCPLQGCTHPVSPIPTPETKPLAPTSVYAVNKRDHEELFLSVGRAYNIPAVALRYFNTYGVRQALSNPYTGVAAIFSSRLLNGKPPVIFEDGLQMRDFVHVSDVVQANLLAMHDPRFDYGVFNVSSGRPTTIVEVAQSLARYLDRPIEPQITRQFRRGDIRHCFADISAIKALGYSPRTDFQHGIASLVEWVSQQKPVDAYDQAHQELLTKGLAG